MRIPLDIHISKRDLLLVFGAGAVIGSIPGVQSKVDNKLYSVDGLRMINSLLTSQIRDNELPSMLRNVEAAVGNYQRVHSNDFIFRVNSFNVGDINETRNYLFRVRFPNNPYFGVTSEPSQQDKFNTANLDGLVTVNGKTGMLEGTTISLQTDNRGDLNITGERPELRFFQLGSTLERYFKGPYPSTFMDREVLNRHAVKSHVYSSEIPVGDSLRRFILWSDGLIVVHNRRMSFRNPGTVNFLR
ncbi:hypothetical protein A3H85_01495 [Candidatus Daviesbacteria bacterium RIFCSPLOWO2_02_FULL_40_8]|uniref:Uncharacterized protein n=1 Tax=Candidatus Daviesbacteria bacterium RIFCSPLOWO2_01_FULL_40_24 TaxID=1797787 RepID=A0A1F5MJV3_9BACT|nr:MAG: hypothetical protein A2780_01220 [Candidatus Daviesbacteria bacterium RIFCSPHIGHO2_01_FULL_41_45]OGE34427.1 MAG: hypothetical protein A3C32_03710 [Candidatus Daviesbacteria bacterium RIFCSPHIGHO2_02_FULL_41_14]OGE65667.1 MAG: hypothetical protein A3B49_03675 [Candidatus Daviesbacteria bacterium RIFCSPLOWO2_01_FULL_40_24]OGE66742.1 MAG: hypothetical protein A3H85_01495 [Candidatus Daviesbacteria bacterium RIFCSPLOWO2_02_FULL_40_8]OGH82359.1 MAG: hypothetical protein A3F93_01060 [Candidat